MARGALFHLLALVALLSASLLQGRSYARCLVDNTLHFTACCQLTPWQDGQAYDEPACCEILQNPALAPAALGHVPGLSLPPALPPAPLPSPLALASLAAAPAGYLDRAPPPARGPPPPSTSLRLAKLSRLRC